MWNCTHFRHPTDEQLRHVDIYFLATTIICSLSTLNWNEILIRLERKKGKGQKETKNKTFDRNSPKARPQTALFSSMNAKITKLCCPMSDHFPLSLANYQTFRFLENYVLTACWLGTRRLI